jgi:ankyrin repeat protein
MGLFKKMAVGIGLIFLTSHHVCPMQYLSSFNKFFKNIPCAKFVAEQFAIQKDLIRIASHLFDTPYHGRIRKIYDFNKIILISNLLLLGKNLHLISQAYIEELDFFSPYILLYNDPLSYALQYNDVVVLKELIKRGIDLNSETITDRMKPIHWMSWNTHNSELVNVMIKEGVPLDVTCERLHPYPHSLPVHRALYYANIDDIRLLGRAGDLKETKDGIKCEDIASHMYYSDREDLKRAVRECMQDMEHSTQELVSAIETQDVSKAKRAIDSWAIVVRKDQYGDTPLHKVTGPYDPIKPTNLDKIAKLIVHAIGRQTRYLRNARGQTPLHIAAMQGNIRLMQLFVRNGAEVDSPDTFGNTPSHYAHDLSTIFFLVDNHADLSIRNNEDEEPLQSLFTLSKYLVENRKQQD